MKRFRGKILLVLLWAIVFGCGIALCLWVDDAYATEVNDKAGPIFYQKDVADILVETVEDVSEAVPEEWAEPVYEEQVYYEEPVQSGYSGGSPDDFQTAGVVYDDGTTYTWYSENVLPGGGLDIPGRSVNEDGYVVDEDGNLCVASSDYDKGTVLDTPVGTAVVYDSGCASGTVDVYTSW